MNHSYQNIINQLKRNSVAFISVIIAVSSLSYNTWRNEKTEDNRNQRFAAFEVLLKLGELQQVVFHSHYDGDVDINWNPRAGWTYVLTIRDLSLVSGEVMTAEANNLYSVWQENWHSLGKEQGNVDKITASIEQMRDTTISIITSLR